MNQFYLLIYFLLNSGITYTCDPSISCGCSILSTVITTRIVGGETAPDHAWGWVASLQKNQQHKCNAVLISNKYALTAAHCVSDGFVASQLRIVAGTNYLYDTSDNVQIRQINAFYIHPSYNPTAGTYDIAVLYFSPLILSLNSTIRFICLPTLNVDPFSIGSNVVTIGWGVTVYGSTTPSPYLQQITIEIFSPTSTDCIQGKISDANLQICAGVTGGGKDACSGDSGGPLMSFVGNKWILAGLTSYGVQCALAGYPGIYTNIAPLVDFIENTMPSKESSSTNSAINEKNLLCKFLFFLISCLLIVINV